MLIPSVRAMIEYDDASLSRRVNANSQHVRPERLPYDKLIKKGEC